MIEKLKRKGIIDFSYSLLALAVEQFVSKFRIFFLKMRSYNVSLTSHIKGNVSFFQSHKNAISIGGSAEVGYGVRIKAGFGGKIKIGQNVSIDDYSFISAQEFIEIGDNTMIASHVYIVDFNHKYPLSKYRKFAGKKEGYQRKGIKIDSGVWIGTHAIILPGVHIGKDAVIGAGAVVTKNIPARGIAVGNPAKVIKKIS